MICALKKSLRAAEQDRPDVTAGRKALQKQQPRLDLKRLVFIDETSVSTTITRLYGRAPQGERLIQKVPHGNWKTITFVAALRHDRVTAPFVLEGPMNGEMFKAYVEQFLAPTLKRDDVVFMDNVSVHKVDGVEEAIEARGAIPFYLPAYSPDLNPIEQLFAKLKALLRKVAAYTLKNAAFTVRSLCKAVASCLDQISRAECAAYLANSGYGPLKRKRWDHPINSLPASALAAGKLMGLPAEKLEQAVNIALNGHIAMNQTRVQVLSDWKNLADADAGRNGVFAALLARQGITGPSPIYEGNAGFFKMISGPVS